MQGRVQGFEVVPVGLRLGAPGPNESQVPEDPVDLINPRSAISGSRELEMRTSRHLYLDLHKITPRITEWVKTKTHWPRNVMGIAGKWLKEGLQERCITRDLKWELQRDHLSSVGCVPYPNRSVLRIADEPTTVG